MLRTNAWLLLPCAALLAWTPASSRAEEPTPHQISDRNGDGVVDRREFNERMVDVFYFLDTDRSGRLEVKEIDGIRVEVFRRADKDGDGRLALAEFLDARTYDFAEADRDGNGVLDPDEANVR